MFKDKLVNVLKQSKNMKKTTLAIAKIKRHERLSSEEFLKVYDTLWKEGPSVKYQNPNAWNKDLSKIVNAP